MWLISGGAYQGKLDYIHNLEDLIHIRKDQIAEGSTCNFDELLKCSVVNHFHLWIDRMLRQEQEVYALIDIIIEKNPSIVIIIDELGCGIVPVDSYDRRFREITGRISCKLAKEAKEVHRVICGIGVVIKHD